MEYTVEYSLRKTVSLCIKNEKLIVKAPLGTSKSKIESIVNSHITWIEKHLIKQKSRNEKYKQLTEEKISELRRSAKMILPKKVEYYSNIMGLKYGRITITSAKTRFGSCSAKGNIAFAVFKGVCTNCRCRVISRACNNFNGFI